MKYALSLSPDNRITSICDVLPNSDYEGMIIVDYIPDGSYTDYLYINGEYIYEPLNLPSVWDKIKNQPSRFDVLEAQIAYIGMMTETLITE